MAAGRVALALIAALALAGPSAAEERAVVGVNRANLAWSPAPVRDAVPRAIAAAGIPAVRVGWREPRPVMEEILAAARRDGLALLIVFNFDEPAREPGPPPAARPGDSSRGFTASPRLSRVSPERFGAWFRSALPSIEASGARVVALQVGNEMNWAGFNGDLPLPTPGVAWEGLEEMPTDTRVAYEEGIRRYVAALREARAALRERPALAAVPLVTGGLAWADPVWIGRTGGSALAPKAATRHLAALGAFAVADGVGNHAYQPFGPAVADPRAALRSAWAHCATPLVGGHPCWVTEFGGAAAPGDACDTREPRRVAQIGAAAAVAAELGPRRVAGLFFYDWDESPVRSLVRCGQVSDAARRLAEWARTGR